MRIEEGPRYTLDDFEPHVVNEVPTRQVPATGDRIQEGQRNDTLFRQACSMRNKGFEEEAILAAISVVNRTKCDPPLPEDEIRSLVRSACRYEIGTSVDVEASPRSADPNYLSAATSSLKRLV